MNSDKFYDKETIKASSLDEAFFHESGLFVHPTSIIGPNVHLGENVKIGPFCVLTGNVIIGDNTRLHAHVTIGFPGQVTGLKQSLGRVEIGRDCEIREFVTIHASRYENGVTHIGNNCYLMNFAHVSHDGFLENNVTLINNVSLGGHTYIEKNAIVMANSATHQFCRIGTLTALAPMSGIRQDLPPFCIFSGQPARFYGLNHIGLKRNGYSSADINALKHVAKLFYQDKLPLDVITQMANQDLWWGSNEHVSVFINFIKNSSRGVSRSAGPDIQGHRKDLDEQVV